MQDEDWRTPLYDAIRHFEAGGKPYAPKWDYKLKTWGFGTPYKPGMRLTPEEAESQMRQHVSSKEAEVIKRFPHLAQPENRNRLLALTDLSYNAGTGAWADKGLGRAVARQDWDDARRRFLQYNKAGGKTLPGLVKRRRWGADLMTAGASDLASYGGAATTVNAGGGGQYLDGSGQMKPVPNAAGAARRDIDERIVRDEAGNVVGLRTGGQADDFLTDWAQARMQVAGSGERPKLSTGEMIGGALQAISVPIAYAQGNNAYANAMLGNGILDRHLASVAEFDKSQAAALQKARMGNIDTMGEYGLQFSEQQQKARQQAEELVARYGEAGMPRARAILRSVGLDEGVLGGGSAQAQRQAPDPTPQISGNTSVPGIGVAQGGVQAPDVANLPTDAAGAPAPVQGAAPAAPEVPQEPALPPQFARVQEQAAELRRRAEEARIYDDEKGAKALEDRADNLEKTSGFTKYMETKAKAEAERPSQEEALEIFNASTQRIDKTLDTLGDLLKPDGSLSDGAAANFGSYYDTYLMNAPGGEAADAWNKIENLRGLFSSQALIDLKKESGAIGSVTEREWDLIASAFGNLKSDSSDEAVAEVLRDAQKAFSRFRRDRERVYQKRYGALPSDRATTDEAPQRTSTEVRSGETVQDASARADFARRRMEAMKPGDEIAIKGKMYRMTEDGTFEAVMDATARGTRQRRAQ